MHGGGSGGGNYLSQVPDGAVREDEEEVGSGGGGGTYLSQVSDGAAREEGGQRAAEEEEVDAGPGPGPGGASELFNAQQCYTCKKRFTELHHFYAQLCPVWQGPPIVHFSAELEPFLSFKPPHISREIAYVELKCGRV